MQEISFEEAVERILAKDSRYHRDAYGFVRDALDFTQKAGANREKSGKIHHVTGQELLEGIRQFALSPAGFGPMTITVLEEWGVQRCRDFGEIVFNMIEIGLLAKTEQDRLEDFEAGYDFPDAFRKPFLPKSKLKTSPPVVPTAND
ncbi:MAG: hypothetical protein IH623_25160 [Verrucomicrobia bacterium]|nr:hypothetical protein [Verrucomicrobiota bacterium]